MAITNTTAYIPGNILNKIDSIASDNSTPKLNSQEFETVQVQKTRDHPVEQKIDTNNKNSLQDFISQTLVQWTTTSSAIINFLSAPVRLFTDDNPLKKIINHVSMFFTKFHLGTYSVAGLLSAFEQKNPLLVFSFLTEGIAAFLGLRSIYLFRGIATGIDGAVAGIKDKNKKSHFSSYKEGWQHSLACVKQSAQDFWGKFTKDPMNILKHLAEFGGSDIAIFASLLASCGGVIGMTIHEKVGAAIRDVSGAVGDYGIFKLDNPIAKQSGFFYLAGSIFDLSARIFNKSIASFLGIKNLNAFERLRDSFHEAAIAFDRIGQFFFLRYNQQHDDHLKTQTRDDHQGYLEFIKAKPNKATELSPALVLAKAPAKTTTSA